MKTIQLNSDYERDPISARQILRAAGVRRIHPGWYSVHYRGAVLDCSTVCGASRNRKGEIRYEHP